MTTTSDLMQRLREWRESGAPPRVTQELCDEAADELERLRAQVAPAGWKLVPTASTPEMRLAANAWTDAAASVWSAMLAASPAAPAQQAEPIKQARNAVLEEAANALEPLKARWLPNVRDIYVVCECAAAIRALKEPTHD